MSGLRRLCGVVVIAAVAAMPARAPARVAQPAPTDREVGGEDSEPAADEPSEPPTSACDPSLFADAKRHYIEASALRDTGRYPEAASEYERAYAACPDARILYNAHLAHDRGGQPVASARAAERYLKLPDCPPRTAPLPLGAAQCIDSRGEVEATLERLHANIGQLALELEAGVVLREIRVAGRVVPEADFPLYLEPGTVEVELFGAEPQQQRIRSVRVIGGERYPLYVGPFESQSEPPTTTGDPDEGPPRDTALADEARRRRSLRGSFWGSLGLTLAAGASLGVVGGLTAAAYRDYNERCTGVCPPDPGFPEDAERRYTSLRPVTNALLGVTIALASVTTVLGAFAFARDGRTRRAGSRASTRIEPSASGLRLRF